MEKLVILRDREFHGFVGTETKVVVEGTKVCIGDVVKVKAGLNNNECKGMVGIFGNKIGVMGLAATPISNLSITDIIQSHKELKLGSHLENGYFKVDRFLE